MEEKDIVLLTKSEYNSLVRFTLDGAKVAGMEKILSILHQGQISSGIYIPNEGLVVGDSGIFTRSICGVTMPDPKGNCSGDILRLNYLGDNDYSNPVILGAGSTGKGITGGAHMYAAVRGDQMVAYVKNVIPDISGKADKSSLASVATSGSYNDLSNKPLIPHAGTTLGTINGETFYMGQDFRITVPSAGFNCVLSFDNATRSYSFSSGNRILIVTPYGNHSLTILSPGYGTMFSTDAIMTTVHYTSWGLFFGNVSTGGVSQNTSYSSINIKCDGPCMVYAMDF